MACRQKAVLSQSGYPRISKFRGSVNLDRSSWRAALIPGTNEVHNLSRDNVSNYMVSPDVAWHQANRSGPDNGTWLVLNSLFRVFPLSRAKRARTSKIQSLLCGLILVFVRHRLFRSPFGLGTMASVAREACHSRDAWSALSPGKAMGRSGWGSEGPRDTGSSGARFNIST